MPLQHRVMQGIKNAVYLGVGTVGRARRAFASGGGEAALLRVLMYHKISAVPGNPPSVPPPLFRAQMQHVRARMNPISVDDLLASRRGDRALPPRAVLVTFDDGYRDNLEHAAPVLSSLGIPALLFLPTAYVGADRPLPHDEPMRRAGVENPTLTWEQAARLIDHGFEIGSHGESHRVFSRLPPDEARAEIVRSRACLEERLGRRVRCFAWVKGAPDTFTDDNVRAVEAAGYEVAFSTLPGPVRPGDPPFTLRRYNVEPFPMHTFARLLDGDCDLIALKDTSLGLGARRALNRILGTTSR